MYLVIEDFKGGLDIRPEILSGKPGTLICLKDGHINSAGEVEKRFAFTDLGVTSTTAGDTYGLLSTSSALYTFGSGSTPSGLNAELTYQRLQHPGEAEGGTASAMTAAIGTVFNDKPFVVATYDDGRTFCFYDGTVVPVWRRGEILPGLTSLNSVRDEFKACLDNVNGLTVSKGISAGKGYVDAQSTPGVPFDLVVSTDSASGVITKSIVSEGTPPVAGTAALGTIRLHAGSSGNIEEVQLHDGSSYQNLMDTASPVAWTTDRTTTAQLVADAINTYKNIPYDVTAEVNGGTIYLYAPPEAGTTFNTYRTRIQVTGDIIVDDGGFTLDGTWAGGDSVDTIVPNGGSDILNTNPVSFNTDKETTASDVATEINNHTGTTGWLAYADGNKVLLGRDEVESNSTSYAGGNPIVVTYTSASGSVGDADNGTPVEPAPIKVQAASTVLKYWRTSVSTGVGAGQLELATRSPLTLDIEVSGGSGNYTGYWEWTGGRGLLKWNVKAGSWQEPVFWLDFPSNLTLTGIHSDDFRLTVTDDEGTTAGILDIKVMWYSGNFGTYPAFP